MYVAALLVPLVLSYFWFSNSSVSTDNAQLKAEIVRLTSQLNNSGHAQDDDSKAQIQMLAHFDKLTQLLERISAVDQQLRDSHNDANLLNSKNADNLRDMEGELSELRHDSAQHLVPAALAHNVLRDFLLFRSNHGNAITLHQQLARSSGMAKDSARLTEELRQAKEQIVLLQAVKPAPAPCPPARPAPAAAAASSTLAPNTELLHQVDDLRGQVAFAKADCIHQRALENDPRSKERTQLLKDARRALSNIPQDPLSGNLRRDINNTIGIIDNQLQNPPQRRFMGL